jgi:vesicle transport through interaction with t-SNAREs protein 1
MSQPLDSAPGTELLASYESDYHLAYSEITQKLDELSDVSNGQ